MRFTKMHGAGNDYIYVDGFRDTLPTNPSATAISLSDRHKGVGADGLILICPSDVADAEMRMFNADGSPSEMCGNGIRCVAKYLVDRGIVTRRVVTVETAAGIKTLEVDGQNQNETRVRVDMGVPILNAVAIPTLIKGDSMDRVVDACLQLGGVSQPVTCVSMGNLHCVIFLDEDDVTVFAANQLVRTLGPRIETDSRFPSRTNVEFVSVDSRSEVHQRTWERGSGETLACGTGACAVCVAGVLTGRTERRLTCHLIGGQLELEWDSDTDHVFMTGPAVEVFRGEVSNV